eukprot:GILJ01005662.1.p1 GENE.GILJ01005662.1~~GILJ01005662.1.p1  ORF type:complete len:153 (+),score=3.78 GILJ01005662.1:33-491(+)
MSTVRSLVFVFFFALCICPVISAPPEYGYCEACIMAVNYLQAYGSLPAISSSSLANPHWFTYAPLAAHQVMQILATYMKETKNTLKNGCLHLDYPRDFEWKMESPCPAHVICAALPNPYIPATPPHTRPSKLCNRDPYWHICPAGEPEDIDQ